MKRIIILFVVTLLSVMSVSAKTVRGYISDQDGNPVVGLKMVVLNVDNPSGKSIAVTDEDGLFSVQVPDNMDTSDLVEVFSKRGARIIRYRETSTGIRIVIEPARNTESATMKR
ncbi:MAG: carboxypeptidase regulatory-like domain-containing protein [Bacteroidales bacterium]|nr:carboxypeptidase regulatory-like domain-containing protein [Bacteroidales bacterium]